MGQEDGLRQEERLGKENGSGQEDGLKQQVGPGHVLVRLGQEDRLRQGEGKMGQRDGLSRAK